MNAGTPVTAEWASQITREAFLGLLDDASLKGHAYFHGFLTALSTLNVLPEGHVELWGRRQQDVAEGVCPATVLGEDCSLGGRAWCAVCGKLPQQEVEA